MLNQSLVEQLLRRNLQLEIICQIARSVTVNTPFTELLDSVTGRLRQVVSYDLLSFCLLQQGRLVIHSGVPRNTPVLYEGWVLDRADSLPWRVIENRRALRVEDVQLPPGYAESGDLAVLGIRAVVIVPLVVRERVLGTLNLGSCRPGMYNRDDEAFLQQVADQLALILENARLYSRAVRLKERWQESFQLARRLARQARRRNVQLEAAGGLSRSITVQMSFQDMVKEVALRLGQMVPHDLLSFCLLEEGRLVIKAGLPAGQTLLAEGTVLELADSVPGRVVREGRPVLRRDITAVGGAYREDADLARLGIRSAVVVPLALQGQVIGTLNLGSRQKQAFDREDVLLLQLLADHLAVCLENSRLFQRESHLRQAWVATCRAVADALLVLDGQCRVVRCNAAYERMRRHFPGRGEQVCFWPAGLEGGCPVARVRATGRTVRQRVHWPGEMVWELAVSPVTGVEEKEAGGQEVVLTIRDVTRQVQLQSRLVHSARLAALGEIAAGVAHELNSPLTAIIGHASLLQRSGAVLLPEKQELLAGIKDCGLRCQKIIRRLLDFSRQQEDAPERVEPGRVVEEALELVGHALRRQKVQLVCQIPERLPPVWARRQQLCQVLVNLLLNAAEALHGTGRLGVEVKVLAGGQRVYWCVRDEGCGVPAGCRERIFQPFYTTRGRRGGTGLGLAISREIARAHGGEILVRSRPGQGSTFCLVLPRWAGEKLLIEQ